MELVCAVSGKPQPTVYWTKGTDRIEPNKGTGLSGQRENSRFRFHSVWAIRTFELLNGRPWNPERHEFDHLQRGFIRFG